MSAYERVDCIKSALDFVIKCCNRWLKIEVGAQVRKRISAVSLLTIAAAVGEVGVLDHALVASARRHTRLTAALPRSPVAPREVEGPGHVAVTGCK